MTHVHFGHFWTLASLILPPRSFLIFLVFRPFPERLVCFGQGSHTEWRWEWFTERNIRDITNCVTIYYEKDMRAEMPSFRKKISEHSKLFTDRAFSFCCFVKNGKGINKEYYNARVHSHCARCRWHRDVSWNVIENQNILNDFSPLSRRSPHLS